MYLESVPLSPVIKAVGVYRRVDVVSRQRRNRHYQGLGLAEPDRYGMACSSFCIRGIEEFAFHGDNRHFRHYKLARPREARYCRSCR